MPPLAELAGLGVKVVVVSIDEVYGMLLRMRSACENAVLRYVSRSGMDEGTSSHSRGDSEDRAVLWSAIDGV